MIYYTLNIYIIHYTFTSYITHNTSPVQDAPLSIWRPTNYLHPPHLFQIAELITLVISDKQHQVKGGAPSLCCH